MPTTDPDNRIDPGYVGHVQPGSDGGSLTDYDLVGSAVAGTGLFALDDYDDYVRINLRCLRNTFIGNFLDACAISLPCRAAGEPPVGLMLMAPHGRDRQLFATAATVEAVLAQGRR